MEPEGFAYDMSCGSLVLNVIPSCDSNPCSKTYPQLPLPLPSTSSSSSSSPGSNRNQPSTSSSSSPGSNRNQPCLGRLLFGSGRYNANGERFWKSLRCNVRKYMECFRPVAARPKDARRVQLVKPAGNAGFCWVRNTQEHDENLQALILHCKNS